MTTEVEAAARGPQPAPPIPLSLFAFALFYGGMVCIAGVLGNKQVALGPLAVEAGIFAFLLLVVTFLPFPTAVLAEYIDTPQANVAVMLYAGVSVVLNVAFTLWWVAMFYPARLLRATVTRPAIRRATVQMMFGSVVYVGATAAAYWFPLSALAFVFGVQLLWVVVASDADER